MYSSMSRTSSGLEPVDLILPDADDVLIGAVAEAAALVRVPVDQSLAGHRLQPAGRLADGQAGPDGDGFRSFGQDAQEDGHRRFVLGEEPAQDPELDAALGPRKAGREIVEMRGQASVDVHLFPHGDQDIDPARAAPQAFARSASPSRRGP